MWVPVLANELEYGFNFWTAKMFSLFWASLQKTFHILIIQCSLITLINHLFRDVSGLPYFLVTVGTVGNAKELRKKYVKNSSLTLSWGLRCESLPVLSSLSILSFTYSMVGYSHDSWPVNKTISSHSVSSKLLSGDKSKMLFRASQCFCIFLSHDEFTGNDNSFYCTINIIRFPCRKT